MNRNSYFSISMAICLTLGVWSGSTACAMDHRHVQTAGGTTVHTERNASKEQASQRTAEFPQKPSGKWNKRALQKMQPAEPPAFQIPILIPSEQSDQVTILGPATVTQKQMVHLIRTRNPKPLLNCSLEELVGTYYEEAEREGIRPDIALCQAIKETGYFGYGGDVLPSQNNFCGLGATGNHVRGAEFATPRLGVRAHIQHLLAYASERIPSTPIEDPRYQHILKNRPEIHGHLQKWIDLNGVWAVPGTFYGQDILKIWQAAKAPDGSDASLHAAEKMVHDAPAEAESYIYRGTVHFAQKSYRLAQMDFQRATELAPQSAEAQYDLALAWDASQKSEEAIAAYAKLTALDSDFWQGWFNLGLLQLKKSSYNDAIRSFENALTRNPQMADAQNEIGAALLKQKKYDDAWNAFCKAHEINSRNEYAITNLTQMQQFIKKK